MKLICATGNPDKFAFGHAILQKHGIELVQQKLDIDEIQGEEPEYMLRQKAMSAFELLHAPVVVTDDWWDIPALGGFPGAYMKSINHWFTPEDFVALMSAKSDRRILLHAYLGYYDGKTFSFFESEDETGVIANEPRGSYGPPIMHVAVMDHDNGKTISEVYDAGKGHAPERISSFSTAWHKLAKFLQEENI